MLSEGAAADLHLAVSGHAEVRWTWIKRHARNALNERVDEIASGKGVVPCDQVLRVQTCHFAAL